MHTILATLICVLLSICYYDLVCFYNYPTIQVSQGSTKVSDFHVEALISQTPLPRPLPVGAVGPPGGRAPQNEAPLRP